MEISERSISALGKCVTGDGNISPYRSGPQLVRLFNDFGGNDVYGQGFPSRWMYAEEKIRQLNGTSGLPALIQHILDPRDFLDSEYEFAEVLEYLNEHLRFDGYEIIWDGDFCSIRDLEGSKVKLEHPFSRGANQAHVFINEQIEKCDTKIMEGDFDGAITNARSLLEAILLEIQRDHEPDPPKYDGDLVRLFKDVRAHLDIEPSRTDIDNSLKQVLGGLISIVNGLAAIRNRMSDAHALSYRPARRHAKLVVNSAKTVSDFLVEVSNLRKIDQA